MLNIPDSIKGLFQADGVRKNFRASFPNGELPDITNENIVQESVRFTESLCSQDVLKFGLSEASVMEFETVDVPNMYGMQIRCSCEIDVSSLDGSQLSAIAAGSYDGELVRLTDSDLGYPFYRVPYGLFRVESCPRNHEVMAKRQVTAYSASFASLAKSLPGIPEQLSAETLLLDPAALLAQATGTNLSKTKIDPYVYPAPSSWAPLYDSSGAAYYLRFYEARESVSIGGIVSEVFDLLLGSQYIGIPPCDFFSAEIRYDPEKHYALGKAVANCLTEAGYRFLYNNEKEQIFSNNEEALLSTHPRLFWPVICATSTVASDVADGFPHWQKIKSGKLHPIVHRGAADSNYAFCELGQNDAPDYENGLFYFGATYAGKAVTHIGISRSGESFEDDTKLKLDKPIGLQLDEVNVDSLTAYTLQTRAPIRLLVENTGEANPAFDQNNADNSARAYQRYSFAIDPVGIVDGWLELNAQFGKVDRYGQLKAIRLSDAAPVDLQPAQYESFWWDEYNVEPIGKIAAAFTDEEGNTQEFAYRIGPGASTYDMSANAVLQQLYGGSVSAVQQLLAERFVPHLGPVNFTPIELDMQGLPYLEDGDYLTVTAEDDTVARSYNMRHELRGVQMLAASVTSVSGEIIDSEEGNE